MQEPSDLELVLQVRGGNRQAFTTLIQRHQTRVYRISRHMVGRHAEADEVAQETFVRAYLSLGDFRNDSNFIVWISRITVNLALNSIRRRQVMTYLRSSPLLVRFLPVEAHGGGKDAPPVEIFHTARLSEKQLSVFVLRFFEGLTFEEISGILNTSARTLELQYSHAIRRIIEHVTNAENTGSGYSAGGGAATEVAPLPD